MRKKIRWTKEEISFLKQNYSLYSCEILSTLLGRPPKTISQKASRIGVKLSEEERHKRKSALGKLITSNNYGPNNPNWKGGISKDNYRYKKRQVERYPDRCKARKKVYNALLTGRIFKLPCLICGEEKVFAHHEDYSKPLEVVWLCRKHHIEYHMGLLQLPLPS
jgi:hypothetical protein